MLLLPFKAKFFYRSLEEETGIVRVLLQKTFHVWQKFIPDCLQKLYKARIRFGHY